MPCRVVVFTCTVQQWLQPKDQGDELLVCCGQMAPGSQGQARERAPFMLYLPSSLVFKWASSRVGVWQANLLGYEAFLPEEPQLRSRHFLNEVTGLGMGD